MSYGNDAETAEESISQALEQSDDKTPVEAGDQCPEDHCSEELHELNHPRDSQLGTDAHPDAPETEIVCIHHGIIRAS